MSVELVRNAYRDIYASAGYEEVPEAPIVSGDESLLYVNSGYAVLRDRPEILQNTRRVFGIQTCVRMKAADKVGDGLNSTSFRMMGCWISGEDRGHATEEAIQLAVEYLAALGLPLDAVTVTYFGGDSFKPDIPADIATRDAWAQHLRPDQVIAHGIKGGVWGPPGDEGLVGPRTDVSFDFGGEKGVRELWNVANFLYSYQALDGTVTPIEPGLVDSGIGLDRTASLLQGSTIHDIDQYGGACAAIYDTLDASPQRSRDTMIIFDHMKTARLILRNGVEPGPRGKESIPRRLLRRVAALAMLSEVDYRQAVRNWSAIVSSVEDPLSYPTTSNEIVELVIDGEMTKLNPSLRAFAKLASTIEHGGDMSASDLFKAHTSTGVPLELIKAIYTRHGLIYPESEMDALIKAHQLSSRR